MSVVEITREQFEQGGSRILTYREEVYASVEKIYAYIWKALQFAFAIQRIDELVFKRSRPQYGGESKMSAADDDPWTYRLQDENFPTEDDLLYMEYEEYEKKMLDILQWRQHMCIKKVRQIAPGFFKADQDDELEKWHTLMKYMVELLKTTWIKKRVDELKEQEPEQQKRMATRMLRQLTMERYPKEYLDKLKEFQRRCSNDNIEDLCDDLVNFFEEKQNAFNSNVEEFSEAQDELNKMTEKNIVFFREAKNYPPVDFHYFEKDIFRVNQNLSGESSNDESLNDESFDSDSSDDERSDGESWNSESFFDELDFKASVYGWEGNKLGTIKPEGSASAIYEASGKWNDRITGKGPWVWDKKHKTWYPVVPNPKFNYVN